jgi:hypothetical protein
LESLIGGPLAALNSASKTLGGTVTRAGTAGLGAAGLGAAGLEGAVEVVGVTSLELQLDPANMATSERTTTVEIIRTGVQNFFIAFCLDI